jgi:tetratricopeptide (TPR) repeat protein
MRPGWLVALAFSKTLAAQHPAVSPAIRARAAAWADSVNQAKHLMGAAHYSQAAGLYSRLLEQLPAQDTTRARLLFQRALALHRRGLSGRDSNVSGGDTSALADYRAARSQDSGAYFAAASANAAVLLRSLGRHAEAYEYFRDAARVAHPARAYFLFNAGREAEALGLPDSAAADYDRALSAQGNYAEARRALLDLYLRRNRVEVVVALAAKWGSRVRDADVVNDALLDVLGRPGTDTVQLAAALVQLASNDAAAGLSPVEYGRLRRGRLDSIAASQRWLASPVSELLHVHEVREWDRPFQVSDGGDWWAVSDQRHHVWSVTLRTIGDWYNAGGKRTIAESYYEAALGYPYHHSLDQRWVDLDALVPLAGLYADRPPGVTGRPLDDFVDQLFAAKGAAYLDNDLHRAREFHMALGALFAQRHQWEGIPAGAIFQLERMRDVTSTLAAGGGSGQGAQDPPELLELLVIGYQTMGNVDSARVLAAAVRAAYATLGRRDGVARMDRVIEELGRR